jgi:MinD superfamily P-loop ATPase
MNIVVSSGKGGTGKTFLSTNLAKIISKKKRNITYVDCDVEEPNGHLFLKPNILEEKEIKISSPISIDPKKCTMCGKCVEVCNYNAIALIKNKSMIFKELCHACGACKVVCPKGAVIEGYRDIGTLRIAGKGNIKFFDASLSTGEGGMSPRLIKKLKHFYIKDGLNIIDSPPGTSCPVVETVKDSDICILVTDPTPFGINDLKLAVDMCRSLKINPLVVVNRAKYYNDDLKNYLNQEKLEILAEIPDDLEIAKNYSVGNLIVEKSEKYKKLFEEISEKLLNYDYKKLKIKKEYGKKEENKFKKSDLENEKIIPKTDDFKQIVVLSGKGGTGKTSITASFSKLFEKRVVSDCDVDAADLHLVLKPEIKKEGLFSGGYLASIIKDKCIGCGSCYEACRFDAIRKKNDKYEIDEIACEGCGTCKLVCKKNAIKLDRAINGKWFISKTRHSMMSHAKLGVAEENSGKLVSLVREKAKSLLEKEDKIIIMDGSPGTGCPVIASVTGTDYAVIVTEPTVSGLHDMKRVLALLKFFKVNAGVIINKYDLNLDMTEKIRKECLNSKVSVIGMIPYDDVITKAQNKGLSVVEYKPEHIVSEEIENIVILIKNILKV